MGTGLPWRDLRGFSGGTRDGRTVLYCTIPSRLEGGRLQGGVYVSDDEGARWRPVGGVGLNRDTKAHDAWAMGPIAQYHQVLTTDADPRRVYVFNSNTAIAPPHHCTAYRSDDAGETWRATLYPDPRWPGFNLEPNYTIAGAGQFFQAVPRAAVCAGDPERRAATGRRRLPDHHQRRRQLVQRPHRSRSSRAGGTRAPAFRNTGLVVTSTWNYYVDPV
jgi:hypothetical protein